jgi:hypothetical protein
LRERNKRTRLSALTVALTVGTLAAITVAFVVVAVLSFRVLFDDLGGGSSHSSLEPVRLIGPEKTVFKWSRDACEPSDYPDTQARAFRDAKGNVQLLASHDVSRRSVGRSLGELRHECGVIMQSGRNPDPAQYDDAEWITSLYTLDGQRVYALIHNEYHGWAHPGRCPYGGPPFTGRTSLPCWYNTITWASSTDGGRSFVQPPAAAKLVAGLPYRYRSEEKPYGLFSPSNIVYNDSDGHYYALVRAEGHGLQKPGVCLIRTSRLDDPGSWRAWDGSDFNVRFIDPYRSDASPDDHVCAPVARGEIQDMTDSLTYNTYFEKYLLVGVAGRPDPATDEQVLGIYYSLSDDLVEWERPKLIRDVELPWTWRCGDTEPVENPSVLDPYSDSPNFETTGQRAWLFFTRHHFSGCNPEPTPNRDLVRIGVEFSK